MLLHWGTQAKTLVSPLPSNIQPAATIWCSYRYGGGDGVAGGVYHRDSIARPVGHYFLASSGLTTLGSPISTLPLRFNSEWMTASATDSSIRLEMRPATYFWPTL